MLRVGSTDALLVVDVQNDFCPGGPLAVPEGDAVVPVINRIVGGFPLAVATQDWHPEGHISFASRHPGREPFTVLPLEGLEQMLWPDHCVWGTPGADLHPDLDPSRIQVVLRKGAAPDVDSYSAFLENDRRTPTGLAGLLRERGVRRVFVTGLATDYCVLATALDGLAAGFEVTVLEDACRAVDVPPGNLREALGRMGSTGVRLMRTSELSLD